MEPEAGEAMKQLRIVSDGTAAGTSFELFDPEAGTLEEVQLPARIIRWEMPAYGESEVTITFDLVSMNVYRPAESVLAQIDLQLAQLVRLRKSIIG